MQDGKSILPNGEIKLVNGKLQQRATVIYHRKCGDFGPGIRDEWLPVTGFPVLVPVLQDPLAPPG